MDFEPSAARVGGSRDDKRYPVEELPPHEPDPPPAATDPDHGNSFPHDGEGSP